MIENSERKRLSLEDKEKTYIKNDCSFVSNAKRLIDSSLTGIEEIVRLGIEPRLLK